MGSYQTLPEMFLRQAAGHNNKRAFNDRTDGRWHPVPMSEIVLRASSLAAELNSRIPEHGASVGILAAPSSQWVIADMAVMLAGHVAVPFFVDFSESHFRHKVEDAEIHAICVFGKTLWERFRPFADRFDLIITDQVVDDVAAAVHLDACCFDGGQRLAAEPGLTERLLQAIDPDDLAAIIYTSGSTGTPKGVELTHRNLVAQLYDIEELFPIRACRDRALSLLPVAHSFERIVIYLYLARGMSVYFVDDIDRLGAMFQEVRPTMMTVVPRLLERTYERIAEKSDLVFGPLGALARWTWRHASRSEGSGNFPLADFAADKLVGWQIRKALGGKLRTMVVGGAHMPDDLNRFFVRMGIPLFEGYGLTEASPVISSNYQGNRKLGTVGRPLPSVSVQLTETGEVLAHGPNIMRGYRNLPDETAQVIDEDGWLHTGDLGQLDEEGYLSIVARKKEMLKTSTGEMVFPQPIERALCRSELVETACLIAEARKFSSVLLFLDPDALNRMKERCGAVHETDDGFANSFAMHHEIQSLIRSVNSNLNRWEKIHAYALLLEPPSIENSLLTPTLKIRRHKVEENYARVIELMYTESGETEDINEFAIGHC